MTFWLYTQAKENPQKTYLFEGDREISFLEMEYIVRQVVAQMKKVGIRQGDHVAIRAYNNSAYIALLHAIPRIGGMAVPLNVRLSEKQVMGQLEQSEATVLIEESTFHLNTDLPRFALESLMEPYTENMTIKSYEEEYVPWDLKRDFAIFFTSGTTGKPKGAVLTLSNIFHNAIGSKERLGIKPDDLWIITLPIYHVGGMSIIFRGAIYGIGSILIKKFDIEGICKAIQSGGSILSLVPTMLHRFLKEGQGKCLAKLRCLLLGGAKANKSLVKRALNEGIPIYTTYGLTEAASQVTTATPEEVRQFPDTVGYPIDGVEVRIAAKPSEIGEISVRGSTIMKGYYKDSQKTSECFRDGWFFTGDLGRIENGRLFTFGRRKDLIVCGGENIYPAEIEACLQEMEGLKEVCAVGVEDEEWGEVVGLAVVPNTSEDLKHLQEQIIEIVSNELGRFKRPRKFIFLEKLPKTATGKVKREEILDLFYKKRR
ncbi:MAG: o-succinylbenzoate--CoA ligase [Methanobacteriota archaeon]|nr:MAG: o-succinylbenzoate--CoA ligase [Euryarchaeota archaeon]